MPIESPVVFLFFNRPHTARRVFARICEAKPSRLVLVSDGPRAHVAGEHRVIRELRGELESMINWPADVITDYAESNLGCSKRISSGVTATLGRFDRAIFLEDDCLPSETFLPYADALLKKHQKETSVASITGTYLLKRKSTPNSYGATHFPCVWGWAAWARSWEGYDRELKGWDTDFLDAIAREKRIAGFMPEVWKKSFRFIAAHPDHTWDYQFWLLCLRRGGLTLFPYANQICNIGGGPGATHSGGGRFCNRPVYSLTFPLDDNGAVAVDRAYEKYLQQEFYSNTITWRNLPHRVRGKVLQFFRRTRSRLRRGGV
jgi:hypothetical protein